MENLEAIEKKYKHAILVLQAISQRDGVCKGGWTDEWSEAAAFDDCKAAAKRALEYLGEPTTIPNKTKSGSEAKT